MIFVCGVVGPNGRDGGSSYVGPARKFRSTDTCARARSGGRARWFLYSKQIAASGRKGLGPQQDFLWGRGR